MRATPIGAKLPSPAELLLKRRVATCLPSPTNENRDDGVHDRLEERRAKWGAVAQWLEGATDNRVVAGSNPAEAVWKLWQFPLPHLSSVFPKRH